MPKIIRLLAPVTTEGRQLEAGAVVPATNDAAELLLKHQPPLAELAPDATERHPSIRLLHTVTIDPQPKKKAEPTPPAPKDKA